MRKLRIQSGLSSNKGGTPMWHFPAFLSAVAFIAAVPIALCTAEIYNHPIDDGNPCAISTISCSFKKPGIDIIARRIGKPTDVVLAKDITFWGSVEKQAGTSCTVNTDWTVAIEIGRDPVRGVLAKYEGTWYSEEGTRDYSKSDCYVQTLVYIPAKEFDSWPIRNLSAEVRNLNMQEAQQEQMEKTNHDSIERDTNALLKAGK